MSQSIQTYLDFIKPTLTKRQREVLEAMESIKFPCTMFEVARKLGKADIAYTISGRFGELKKRGYIQEFGKTHKRYLNSSDEKSSFTLYKLVETLF